MRKAALLTTLSALCACALFQGPPPPDLTSRNRVVLGISERVSQIQRIMDADIGELERLPVDFFATSRDTYAPPFPIDLFKQTAMSCLNQPVTNTPPEPTGAEETIVVLRETYGRAITCNPAALPYCLEALKTRAPNTLQTALLQLERVDRLRLLHARLKQRAARMPLLIRQQRELLAKRRADWRQVDRDLQRQREEFTPKNWASARARMREYQERIDALAQNIDALEATADTWTTRIQRLLDTFYLDLAGLYDRPPGSLPHDPSRSRPLGPSPEDGT